MIAILNNARATDRARVYHQLGVNLTYLPAANRVQATADLARVARGVGGGTFPPATRETVLDIAA